MDEITEGLADEVLDEELHRRPGGIGDWRHDTQERRRRAVRAMPRAAGASPASDALSALTQASDVPPNGDDVLAWSGTVTPRQPIAGRC